MESFDRLKKSLVRLKKAFVKLGSFVTQRKYLDGLKHRFLGLSFADYISLIAVVLALYAAHIAVVAMNHADDGAKQTLDEMKQQQIELEKSRALLDKSTEALSGVLNQSKLQVENSKRTVDQLDTQLSLNRKQTRLATQQVDVANQQLGELKKEFEKQPTISVALDCFVPSRASPNGLRTNVHLSDADFNTERAVLSPQYAAVSEGYLDCEVSLKNIGTDFAKSVQINVDLPLMYGNLTGLRKGANELTWGISNFTDVTIESEGRTSNAWSRLLELHRWESVAPSALSDNEYKSKFRVNARSVDIKAYKLELLVRSDNARLAPQTVTVKNFWRNDDYWKSK